MQEMLNPMEFNKINDFQKSVTHTHSKKDIYITPTSGVSKTHQRWETNPQDCQMTYPETELSMVTYKIVLVVLYVLTQEQTNRY
jgi:hypothetical protein